MALTIAYLFPRNDATGIDDQGSISVSWRAPVLTLVTSTSSRLIRNPWELIHRLTASNLLQCMSLLMCRFSDAGMTRLSTRCGGRRPKSAKARNRGKWGTGGAAGAMEDLAAVR